jgi:predicted lipoprotein with Yx(FWY)xxD motif
MRLLRVLIISLVSVLLLAACGSSGSKTKSSATTAAPEATTTTAAAGGATVNASQTKLGSVLADSKGRTLYHLNGETATSIKCTGGCASTWPPLMVQAGQQPTAGQGVSGTLAAVDRPDGTKQAAFNGQPLYTYAGDTKAGDTNGEGVGGVWHVVKASATTGTTTAGAGTGTATTKAPATTAPSAYGY